MCIFCIHGCCRSHDRFQCGLTKYYCSLCHTVSHKNPNILIVHNWFSLLFVMVSDHAPLSATPTSFALSPILLTCPQFPHLPSYKTGLLTHTLWQIILVFPREAPCCPRFLVVFPECLPFGLWPLCKVCFLDLFFCCQPGLYDLCILVFCVTYLLWRVLIFGLPVFAVIGFHVVSLTLFLD